MYAEHSVTLNLMNTVLIGRSSQRTISSSNVRPRVIVA